MRAWALILGFKASGFVISYFDDLGSGRKSRTLSNQPRRLSGGAKALHALTLSSSGGEVARVSLRSHAPFFLDAISLDP